MFRTLNPEPRALNPVHVLLVVMLTVSLLGHQTADAAGSRSGSSLAVNASPEPLN